MGRKRSTKRNFGHIEQLKSGRYRAKYWNNITATYVTAPVTYTNKAEADLWLQSERLAIETNTWRDWRELTPILNDYARRIIENKPKPKTVEGDLQSWNTHVAPYLGTIRVADLTTSQVNAWHSERKQSGVGDRALSKAYAVLRNVLNCAVNEELRQTNPCKIKGGGSTHSVERPTLTPEQVTALAEAVEPRYRALVLVMTYCLLRKGEATALRRSDLHKDLRTGVWTLTVNRKVQDQPGGGWRYGTPKTKAGVRTLIIPQTIVAILEQHLNAYVEPGNNSLVFTSSNGEPAYRSGSDSIRRALKRIGLDKIKGVAVHTHDLRHTGATWLVQAGATIPELQKYLGDSSPTASLRYAHASGTNKHLADRLSNLYEGTA